MSAEVTLTNDNFEKEVLNSDIPVLVDFWADWCVPCKMIGPVVESLAEEYDGKLKVAKANVDDTTDVAQKYGIISIPTLMVFNKGELVKQQTGAVAKPVIEEMFKDLL